MNDIQNILRLIVIVVIFYLIFKMLELSNRNSWEEVYGDYYITSGDIALIYKRRKLIKTVTKEGHIRSKAKNITIFDKTDKTLNIRKYKFRTKDFNAINLDICLKLQFKNIEKLSLYVPANSYVYTSTQLKLIEMLENIVIDELELILKKYTRKEYFMDKSKIVAELKEAKSKEIYDISGYELKDLFIYELRN